MGIYVGQGFTYTPLPSIYNSKTATYLPRQKRCRYIYYLLSRTLRKVTIGSGASDGGAIEAEFGVIGAGNGAVVGEGEKEIDQSPDGDEEEERDEGDDDFSWDAHEGWGRLQNMPWV
jgi:hypothetical protein